MSPKPKPRWPWRWQTFERVSLDLIYARPGPDGGGNGNANSREALSFGTEHLSLYQLTIEPATPFATLARTGALTVPDDDSAAALYELTQEMTKRAGRPAYEISNHAAPGAECRHNLIYWRYGAYAGVGPGAHGRLDLGGKRVATACEKLPERWRERCRARRPRACARLTEIAPARCRARTSADEFAPGRRARSGRLSRALGRRARRGADRGAGRGRVSCAATAHGSPPRRKGRLVLNSVIAELAAELRLTSRYAGRSSAPG